MISKSRQVILLLTLSFISGICGLAYEILYSRILTNWVGHLFYVNSTILISFLIGVGVASIISWRYVRYLWLIELCIGLYAFIFSWLWRDHYQWLIVNFIPSSSQNIFMAVIVVFIFVFPAAFLIGLCVPIFTHYLEWYYPEKGRDIGFHFVYIFYNMGAAFSTLAIEFWLLRQIGIRNTIVTIGVFNIINALFLFRITPPKMRPCPKFQIFLSHSKNLTGILLALFFVSVVSGINQIVLLKTLHAFWGPYNEQFATLLAMALLGISIGTVFVNYFKIDFDRLLLFAPGLLALSFLSIPHAMDLWAGVNKDVGLPQRMFLKLSFIFFICGIPLTIFGSTVSSAHRHIQGLANRTGIILGIASFGNCLGYILTVFFLFEQFDYITFFFIIVALTFYSSLFVVSYKRSRSMLAAGVTVCLMLAILRFIPGNIFHFSNWAFTQTAILKYYKKAVRNIKSFRKYDSEISLLDFGDRETLIVNGYYSFNMFKEIKSNPNETLSGIIYSPYLKQRDHALALGIGTGITVGAMANLFKKITAVEIDPLMVDMLPYFTEYNFGLHRKKNVQIILDDALAFLLRDKNRYDCIVMNASTPQHSPAAKLWTHEYFELIKKHLTPTGIYSQWFGELIDEKGLRILFSTMQKSFQYCHLAILNAGYYVLICSNSELEPSTAVASQWPLELRKKFQEPFASDPNLLLEALIFPIHNLMEKDWQSPVNTIDKPVFEFARSENWMLSRKHKIWWLLDLAEINFNKSIFIKDRDLNSDEIKKRCQYISQWTNAASARFGFRPCKGLFK